MFNDYSGDRPDYPNVLFVLSDGECSTCEWKMQSGVCDRIDVCIYKTRYRVMYQNNTVFALLNLAGVYA